MARPALVAAVFLAALAVVFLGVGGVLLTTRGPQEELARVAALPRVGAASWGTVGEGATVLVEGHLAPSTPAAFRDFVAARRERYAGKESSGPFKGTERWTLLEVLAPPLEVAVPGGAVAVTNRGYELRAAPHRWRDVTFSSDVLGSQGERAQGFRAGDAVVVEGRVLRGGAGSPLQLEAAVLFGGDLAAYDAAAREGVAATKVVGAALAGVGGLLALVAALLAWRGRRPKRARG